MKATGIVRKVDELGRIVLPMELRRTLNINIKDPLEIFVDENSIVLKKYGKTCKFCGNNEQEQLKKFGDTYICSDCIEKIKKL